MSDEIKKTNHMESNRVLKAKTAGQLIEYEPTENADNDEDSADESNKDTEAVTKEEEWVTKKKTELTTVRQIETRVKRQVTLEDGKVIDDSGPIVYTNTTEDKQKQESETTEKRNLAPSAGIAKSVLTPILETQDVPDGNAVETVGAIETVKLVARPPDGLLKESEEKRVISHEEIDDRLETEEVRQLGDFTDEFYLATVNKEGVENFYDELAKINKSLVPTEPRIVSNTSKSFKTIDSENVHKRSLLQDDGTLVTERKTDTEHEVIVDKELPDGAVPPIESEKTASQRYFKQRDEQNVDILKNGKLVETQTKFATESTQVDSDGTNLKRPGDWDTFSERIRKNKQIQEQAAMQFIKDRKDALTQQRLNFDSEEETRKGETMKWLESHFGSESSGSNDDTRGQAKPTKKTYFNVIIKSSHDEDLKNSNSWAQTVVATPSKRISNEQSREFQDKTWQNGNGGINSYRHSSNLLPVNRPRATEFRADPKSEYVYNKSSVHGINRSSVDLSDNVVRKPATLKESSGFLANSHQEYKSNSRRKSDFIASNHDQRQGAVQFNTLDSRRRAADYRDEARAPLASYPKESAANHDYRFRQSSVSEIPSTTYIQREDKDNREPQRPIVPQRKKTLEKRLSQHYHTSGVDVIVPLKSRSEPPPDFLDASRNSEARAHQVRAKSSEKTYFHEPHRTLAPVRRDPTLERRALSPKSSNGIQSTHTQTHSKKGNRVGQMIRNSLRKFVNKIRSVSAERKFRHNSTNTSGSILHMRKNSSPGDLNVAQAPTYQQYNQIDGHISSLPRDIEDEEQRYGNSQHFNKKKSISHSNLNGIDSSRGPGDFLTINRTQRYYLGEDPYSRTPYRNNERESRQMQYRDKDKSYQQYHTFDRFGRTHKRFTESTPNLNEDYRNIQTLPRGHHHAYQSSQQYLGPKKPARLHAKPLNRSRSINIPELDGSSEEERDHEYKRTPHGNEASNLNALKSPSIVNLVNRSQKEHPYKYRDDDVQL